MRHQVNCVAPLPAPLTVSPTSPGTVCTEATQGAQSWALRTPSPSQSGGTISHAPRSTVAVPSLLPSASRALPSRSYCEMPAFCPASISGEADCRRKSSAVCDEAPQFVTILFACDAEARAGENVSVRVVVLIAEMVRETPSLLYSILWPTEKRAATGMIAVVVVPAAEV